MTLFSPSRDICITHIVSEYLYRYAAVLECSVWISPPFFFLFVFSALEVSAEFSKTEPSALSTDILSDAVYV